MNKHSMMFSNVFLILPVLFAEAYHQWLYFFFAAGLCIFSPLYHWYKITNPRSRYFTVFKTFDWAFALGAFVYMYYYIYSHTEGQNAAILYILLSLVVVFFWYGWKRADYKKLHPWFHIIAPIVSSIILVVAHLSI
jgi:hypothetical protein